MSTATAIPPESSRRSSTGASSSSGGQRPLLVIVLDVSPSTWGEREMQRAVMDKARFAKGKTSAGPATLEEMLLAIRAFCGAYGSLQRDAVLVIVAVAGNEKAVVYPTKVDLQRLFEDGGTVDIRKLHGALVTGEPRRCCGNNRQ